MNYKELAKIKATEPIRYQTGFEELDKVLNGGLVGGAVILFAGVTGSGKSTLVLQIAQSVASRGYRVLYVSGEENLAQIKKRATRLGVDSLFIYCSEETEIEEILKIADWTKPHLVIVDSLQTMRSIESNRGMGTPTQMKLTLDKTIKMARSTGRAVVVIGHSTKGGYIAGLKTLQHMVDATLYLDADGDLRTLEVKKNRFGASYIKWTGRMTEKGLVEDPDAGDEPEKSDWLGGLGCLATFFLPFMIVWKALGD